MKKTITILLVSMFLLSACATHRVVTTHQVGDRDLSCKQIERQIYSIEDILEAIDRDDEEVTAAEVWGIIGFGIFGYAADQHNTLKALDAANERLDRLETIAEDKGC